MNPQQPPAYQPPNPYSPQSPQGGAPLPATGQAFTSAPPPLAPYQPSAPFQPNMQQATGPNPTDIPPIAQTQVMSVAQQVAQQINNSNNVLVTVSNDPSVDQLSAAIGMALILNKLGKHATAVFSGAIPPALEFLQPEKTLEKNTDSLRDFIIALDKAKADKLRYKIEDKYVKIFITPYRTKIDQKDLQFTQGELNVDVVITLGVKTQNELDQAIAAHGQILHDATTISINHQVGASLGSINWNETRTSSLCELVAKLAEALQVGQPKQLLDKQVATALLTGAVAETDRFSNSKTTPETMTMAAKLMDAGANQPLISSKLEKTKPASPLAASKAKVPAKAPADLSGVTANAPPLAKPAPPPDSTIDSDGSLHIAHDDSANDEDDGSQIHIDEHGQLQRVGGSPAPAKSPTPIQTPAPIPTPIPAPDAAAAPAVPITAPVPEAADNMIDGIEDETLTDIEKAVNSPHLKDAPPPPPPITPNPNPLLSSDPSQSLINSAQPPDLPGAAGSTNVNSGNPNEGPLFTPAGKILPSQPGGSTLPPPVPPPMTAGPPPDNNMSDPGSGVPL